MTHPLPPDARAALVKVVARLRHDNCPIEGELSECPDCLVKAEALLAPHLVALQRDTERLDFLEAQRENWAEEDGYGGQELVAHTWMVGRYKFAAQKTTFREAIDAEMVAAMPSTPAEGQRDG